MKIELGWSDGWPDFTAENNGKKIILYDKKAGKTVSVKLKEYYRPVAILFARLIGLENEKHWHNYEPRVKQLEDALRPIFIPPAERRANAAAIISSMGDFSPV